MEKVKVTQKQADWLDRYELTQHQIDHYINIQAHRKRPDSPIVDWEISKLARALYIGYEVEPEVKVGDFVDIGLFGVTKTAEVTGVKGNKIAINGSKEYNTFNIKRILTDEEKQVEKQRRWWADNGREPWELKKGDSLIESEEVDCPDIVFEIGDFNIHFADGHFFPKKYIEENYRVFCFAEDRKDIS